MNIWAVSTFWPLWIMLLWTWVNKYLCKTLFSVLWGAHPEVGLLNHMVLLFLISIFIFIYFFSDLRLYFFTAMQAWAVGTSCPQDPYPSQGEEMITLTPGLSKCLSFGRGLVMGQSAGRRVCGAGPPGHPVMGQPVSTARVVVFKDLTVVITFFCFGGIDGKFLSCACHRCIINL